MKAAILSASPVLLRAFDPDEDFAVRVGVNAAAAVVPVDYWSAGDAQTVEQIDPIGLPVIWTMNDPSGYVQIERVTSERRKRHRVRLWSDIETDAPWCWTNWSITAALVLAVDLGADDLHVFGHGPFGTVDCIGRELAVRAENWRRVNADLAEVTEWARRRGVAVTHREAAVCSV